MRRAIHQRKAGPSLALSRSLRMTSERVLCKEKSFEDRLLAT
jgi:hypothetical protein